MKLSALELYVLFQIARFLNAPEILELISTCKHFRKIFDSESIWKERNRNETFSPRQSRCSVKKIRSTGRTVCCIPEAKRIYIAWWTCFIQQRKKMIGQLFELNYEQALLKSMREEVAATISTALKTKVLNANDTQQKCPHRRILFNLSKRIVQQQRAQAQPFVLHAQCSSCIKQCMGSTRYCCCCEAFLCESCFERPGKSGHDRHPSSILHQPERGSNLHSAYTCGCFDCGITVQVEVQANTHRSMSSTHNNADGRGTLGECALPVPLVTVTFRCAGVDGLFRQKCRTEQGQQELLGRFRTSDDFLLEA